MLLYLIINIITIEILFIVIYKDHLILLLYNYFY